MYVFSSLHFCLILYLEQIFPLDDVILEADHVLGLECGPVMNHAEDTGQQQGHGGQDGEAVRNVRIDACKSKEIPVDCMHIVSSYNECPAVKKENHICTWFTKKTAAVFTKKRFSILFTPAKKRVQIKFV